MNLIIYRAGGQTSKTKSVLNSDFSLVLMNLFRLAGRDNKDNDMSKSQERTGHTNAWKMGST